MQSYKHKATRPLIPSKEEAGMEVVTRGQDPE